MVTGSLLSGGGSRGFSGRQGVGRGPLGHFDLEVREVPWQSWPGPWEQGVLDRHRGESSQRHQPPTHHTPGLGVGAQALLGPQRRAWNW